MRIALKQAQEIQRSQDENAKTAGAVSSANLTAAMGNGTAGAPIGGRSDSVGDVNLSATNGSSTYAMANLHGARSLPLSVMAGLEPTPPPSRWGTLGSHFRVNRSERGSSQTLSSVV